MDREEDLDIDVYDDVSLHVELPDVPRLDAGDGGGGLRPPDERTGGGGGGNSGPAPQPFTQSRWGVMVPVGLMLLFGLQSLGVLWVSRAGLGSESSAWLIAGGFVVTFTAVFIVGSRYIAKHRNG